MKHSILVTRMGDIIAAWTNPIAMNHMLCWYATGWHGDPYAMVQRQKEQQELASLASST